MRLKPSAGSGERSRCADQVLEIIDVQLSKVPSKTVNALVLVGGLSSSQYLFQRVRKTYADRIKIIVRPRDSDVSVLKGAARYGLGKATVSSVISPRSYIMSGSAQYVRDVL